MAQDIDRQELAIRYLLGDLSEEEEKTIGRWYLSESKASEELEIAEDELIDRHVRNELSAKDSSRFKEMLLSSPRLRERVEFAKILVKRVSSESPLQAVTPGSAGGSKPRKKKGGGFFPWGGFWGTTTGMAPALRFALSASVTLMLIASAVLVFIWMRQRAESQRLAREQQQQHQRETERSSQQGTNQNRPAESNQAQQVVPEVQQQRQKQADQPQSQIFAFFLSPATGTRSIRGPEYRTLNIPRKAPSVQLNFDVEREDYGAYSVYNASLENTSDNRVIARENNLKPFTHRGRKHIRLEVPRRDLTDGLYIVHVDGVTASGQTENFNDYAFRVRIR